MMVSPMLFARLLTLRVLLLPVMMANGKPNFIVMQPDDFEFMNDWTPPPHFRRNNDGEDFPEGGLPNIERLRTQGVQMMQAYTASPMCGTSRYSTMTGRYPSRSSYSRDANNALTVPNVVIPTTKLQDVNTVLDGLDCTDNNLASMLNKNGYRTGVVGKWHLLHSGNSYTYEGTQDSIRSCGFHYVEAIYAENLSGGWVGDDIFTHNMEYVAAKAVDFIRNDTSGEPFFLYLNPTVPHSSGDVSDALTIYPCTTTPEGNLTEEPSVKGMTEGTTCDDYRQTIFDRGGVNATDKDLGSIWVDDAIGSVLTALEETDQLENTFFLFQMDHGQEGKGTLYEPGARLAQFIYFPTNFTGGLQFNGLVSTIDIGPTIRDLAGIDETSDGYYEMDGLSWWSALEDTSLQQYFEDERCLFIELDYDRVVRCGCNKLLKLDPSTTDGTATSGERFGMAYNESELLFYLCDDDGEYDTEDNHERIEADDDQALADLMAWEACHADRILPANEPDYSVQCGPAITTASPTDGPSSTTNTPTISSSPTAAPVTNPPPCFSSSVTALVNGKGPVQMKDISVGDEVLTGTGTFQKVYALDHFHRSKPTEFLQFHTGGQLQQPLELTPLHMIYKQGQENPVPAMLLEVGDSIPKLTTTTTNHNGVHEFSYEKVTKITKVVRNGFFNVLTPDGTIVVDGILASTYPALLGREYVFDVNGMHLMSHQAFVHMALAPIRAAASIGIQLQGFSSTSEEYHFSWFSQLHTLFFSVLEQQRENPFVQICCLALTCLLMSVLWILSMLILEIPLQSGMILLLAATYVFRKSMVPFGWSHDSQPKTNPHFLK